MLRVRGVDSGSGTSMCFQSVRASSRSVRSGLYRPRLVSSTMAAPSRGKYHIAVLVAPQAAAVADRSAAVEDARPRAQAVFVLATEVEHLGQRLGRDDAVAAVERQSPSGRGRRRWRPSRRPPTRPSPRTRGQHPAVAGLVEERRAAAPQVAVRGVPGRGLVRLEDRLLEAQRIQQPVADDLRDVVAGDLPDDLAQQHEVGVGVVEAASRGAVRLAHEVQDLRSVQRRSGSREHGVVVARRLEVVGDAAGVAQQLADRDALGARDSRAGTATVGRRGEATLVHELHHDRRHEGLGDARDAEHRVSVPTGLAGESWRSPLTPSHVRPSASRMATEMPGVGMRARAAIEHLLERGGGLGVERQGGLEVDRGRIGGRLRRGR